MEEKNKNENVGVDNPHSQINSDKINVRKRYHALRIIAGVYNVMAWVIIAGSFIGLIIVFADENFGTGLAILFGGSLLALGLFAIAESIKVFIDIEFNTRKVAEK